MRRAFVIAAAVWLAVQPAAAAENPFPELALSYLLERDGVLVGAQRAEQRRAPASLTKIMTGLLAIERGDPAAVVTVSPAAAAETGKRLGLKAGERWRMAELLAAALLVSANDACHALADGVAGSETAFVALMNERARQLGLADTRFANACGHDAPGHRSTAADLARLARAAMADPRFAAMAATVRIEIASADGRRRFTLNNVNELVGRYPGAIGVKTGTTAAAGLCLIALARRDGREVLLVMLGARERWWSAVEALDAAFAAP